MNDEEALRQAQHAQEVNRAQQLYSAQQNYVKQQANQIEQEQKARQNANNANAVMAAANVAEASGHPVASTIGKGVKIADKVTGGKSTEKLGKAVSMANKASGLKGKMAPKAINKLSESGTADRISKAVSAKNGTPTSKGIGSKGAVSADVKSDSSKSKGSSLFNSNTKSKTEEGTSGEGFGSFSGDFKIVKYGLIATAIFLPVALLVVLFMSASRIYQVSIGLGHADNLTDKVEEDKINKKINSEDFENDTSSVDITDEEKLKFRNSKLSELNLEPVATTKSRYMKRKYNEATLAELRDFYPAVTELGKNYDETMVYDFFLKMYNLYTYYNENYPVDSSDKQPILNLPLLMATLMLQSDDMNVVFESNLDEEDRKDKMREQPVDEYAYDYDWSGTILSKDSSTHDMEILAQHMVSKQVKESCTDSSGKVVKTNVLRDNEIGSQVLTCDDGQTYSASEEHYGFDNEKYKEFLKEFIEKKYFEEGVPLGSGVSSVTPSFTKYELTEEELLGLASLCYHEQGSVIGAAAEASLIANRFEISPHAQAYKDSHGATGTGLYHYARESGWWDNAASSMDSKDAPSDAVEAVRKVLVEGMRTLPGYIDEHDCFDCNDSNKCSSTDIRGDICKLDNGSQKFISISDIKNRNNYKSGVTRIYNVYDRNYLFYSFPTSTSSPFGYTDESLRESIGDCHYNGDTWEAVDCQSTSSNANNEFARAMIDLANQEYDNNQGYSDGLKYTNAMGYAAGTPWCAIFVSWLSQHTTVNGKSVYPDIVNFQSAGVYQFMHYFYYDAKKENIKFYYNDSCSKMSGKNSNTAKYKPKPGDYIFFDWQQDFSDISDLERDVQDHIGIVEKSENGQVYTIEGNSSNDLKKQSYNMNDCRVIGFGSWY